MHMMYAHRFIRVSERVCSTFSHHAAFIDGQIAAAAAAAAATTTPEAQEFVVCSVYPNARAFSQQRGTFKEGGSFVLQSPSASNSEILPAHARVRARSMALRGFEQQQTTAAVSTTELENVST